MKIADILDLAKAGYTPADVFKLLELVETSPKIQDAAPEDLEDAKHIEKEEPQALENVDSIDTTGSKDEVDEDENEKILDKLFED